MHGLYKMMWNERWLEKVEKVFVFTIIAKNETLWLFGLVVNLHNLFKRG